MTGISALLLSSSFVVSERILSAAASVGKPISVGERAIVSGGFQVWAFILDG